MVDVSNGFLGSTLWTGNVRMGDPVPFDQDARLVTLVYPYPTAEGAPVTYASWKIDALGWSWSETIGPDELFQLSDDRAIADTPGKGRTTVLHAERAGPLDWLLVSGLF